MNYIRHLTTFYAYVKHDPRLTPCHISLYMALFQYWNFNRFQTTFPVYRDNLMQLSRIGSKTTYHKCIRELHQARYIHYHPPISKFQPIKVSVLRLDRKEEKDTAQLDLFISSEKPPASTKSGTGNSTKTDTSVSPGFSTVQVPHLTATSPHSDTGTVPKVGQNIKHKHINSKLERDSLPEKLFVKNRKIQAAVNNLAGVPNMGHAHHNKAEDLPPPAFPDVESYFRQNHHPPTEAKKFFSHYKAIGWRLSGNPVRDWQALAEKWIINTPQFNNNTNNSKTNESTSTNTNTSHNPDYSEPL